MAKIPDLSLKSASLLKGELNRSGKLRDVYSPLQNLQDENDRTLGNFTTEKLNFDLEHPVDILIQDSYDGSTNMILNDDKNQPRLIGTRFAVQEDKTFKIVDHVGYRDTNIYDEKTFDIDTSLKAIAKKIPQVHYEGQIQNAGTLKCGAYTFYFKLADADGNESEVLAESGIVQIHIGEDINPDEMRMGMQDEDSCKSVHFIIDNIDSGFDYVHVLYARSSSGNDQAAVDNYAKVLFDYPVYDETADITITGREQILGISAKELYTDYADIECVKTQTVVNNVLFFGNIDKKERDWEAMRRASWKIIPSCNQKANVGVIPADYKITVTDSNRDYAGGYYNSKNVYYRLGYWPDEIYRFGIVYIFNDNSMSPVFNVQGIDLSRFNVGEKPDADLFFQTDGAEWESEPDDFYFKRADMYSRTQNLENTDSFTQLEGSNFYRLNSRGVIKFPKTRTATPNFGGKLIPEPLYISFDLSNIGKNDLNSDVTYQQFCELH